MFFIINYFKVVFMGANMYIQLPKIQFQSSLFTIYFDNQDYYNILTIKFIKNTKLFLKFTAFLKIILNTKLIF